MYKFISTIITFSLAITSLFSPALASAASASQSYNWSGYVATGSTYTAVSGSWVVPSVSNTNQAATDVTWVGIGGISSSDIIQAGTQAVVNPSGPVTYQAWYELLPASTQAVPLAVAPGNSISVSITEQGTNSWTVSFKNNSTGQSYQQTLQYASSHSSVEWIEELPSTVTASNQTLPLDNFGTIQFNEATAVANGSTLTASQLGAAQFTLVDSNYQVLATPSQLGSDGQSFSVTRSNVSTSPLSNNTGGNSTSYPTNTTTYQTPTGSITLITYYGNRAPTQTTYQYVAPQTVQQPTQQITQTPVQQNTYQTQYYYTNSKRSYSRYSRFNIRFR